MLSNLTRLRPVNNIWLYLGMALVALDVYNLSTGGGVYGYVFTSGLVLFALAFIVDWRLAPVKVKVVKDGS